MDMVRADLGLTHLTGQHHCCNARLEMPASGVQLAQAESPVTGDHGLAQYLCCALEEERDGFHGLMPSNAVASEVSFRSDMREPWSPNQSIHARRLYLSHQSFLC